MDNDVHELVRNSVECSVCLDTLDTPVFLNCLHTFCAKHMPNLSTFHNGLYAIHCPLCRTNTSVKSFNMLKKNLLAQTVAEAIAFSRQKSATHSGDVDNVARLTLDEQCAICAKGKADVYCVVCEQSFCPLCDSKIHRSTALRQHTRVPIDKKNQPIPVLVSVYPQEGTAAGNTALTIHGKNFGSNLDNITVAVGGNICFNTTLSANPNSDDNTSILKVLTPKGAGRSQQVSVSIGGIPCNEQLFFSYFDLLAPMTIQRYGLGCVAVDNKVYALGGCVPGVYYHVVEEYNPATNTWARKADIPTRSARTRFGCAAIDKKIYMIGGYEHPIIEIYDVEADSWSTIESNFTKRFSPSCVALDRRLFLIGGSDTNSLEEYIVDQNKWIKRANMTTNRRLMGCTVVNGKIYAIGGFDGRTRYSLVEEYDPIADKWTTRASMTTHRDGLSVAVVNNKIYAMGGWNGTSGWLDTVEKFDPLQNKWSTVANMISRRNVFGSAAVGDKIFAIGGHDGLSELDSVEQYFSTPNVWSTQTKYAIESHDDHSRATAVVNSSNNNNNSSNNSSSTAVPNRGAPTTTSNLVRR